MTKKQTNLFQYMSELLEQGIDPASREPEIRARYGRTVAVLVLDSSGFSRVSESHGIVHFLARLMLMRQTAQPVFSSHGATTVHYEADNVFAFFDDVDAAVGCARDLHRSIAGDGIMLTEDESFRVGIGIGYGELLYSETLEGYFGEEMNFASKLGEDTADGNETLLTERAYAALGEPFRESFEPRSVLISGVSLKYYQRLDA